MIWPGFEHKSTPVGSFVEKKENRMKIQLETREPVPASLAVQLAGGFEEPSLLNLCAPW